MEQKLGKQPKLTRRGFLKTMAAGTAAATAALSLPGVALSETTGRQIENEHMKNIPGSNFPLAALDKIP